MSFNISARGVGKIGRKNKFFQYDQRDCVDGDDFEMLSTIASLTSMKKVPEDFAKETLDDKAGSIIPSIIGKATVDLASAYGKMQLLRALSIQISLLHLKTLSCKNKPCIFLTARESRFLRPDSYSIAKFHFYNRDEPGVEFIKVITPALKATDMNNYGVIRELIGALANYYEMLSKGDTPHIMIDVWK